jgi:hypothetical protein
VAKQSAIAKQSHSVFSVLSVRNPQPSTRNPQPEQKNFRVFLSHNQRIKKKIAKEIKKDLESPKRVLLLHPH